MKYLLLFLLSLSLGFGFAQLESTDPGPDLSPEVFEIAKGLRCPVCQGESAGESNSGIAKEMRNIIAEQLQQGKTKQEIVSFFVQRYGEWIVFAPPRKGITLVAWLSPLIGLGILGYFLWRYTSRVKKIEAVSEEELAEMERKLSQEVDA